MIPQDAIRRVGHARVLYVMAVDLEYGPHLRSRFVPLITGVGPVEAGIVLAEALAVLRSGGGLPDLVVSLGSAGSNRLAHTEVYQARSVSFRDMDATALGFLRGETPFLGLPAALPLEPLVPGLPTARLSTGANIVSGAGYKAIDADMVDMETYALKRACMRLELPLIALRGISDGVSEVSRLSDWTDYLHIVDEKLAAAVDRLEGELPAIMAGTAGSGTAPA